MQQSDKVITIYRDQTVSGKDRNYLRSCQGLLTWRHFAGIDERAPHAMQQKP